MRRTLAAILLITASGFADSRDWTDHNGKHHVTASLADFQNGIAYLKEDDGKVVHIPVSRLSKADQDFIKSTVPEVQAITGKVVGVTDGDTVTVLDRKTQYKIRLEGIDAPESHQAYGSKSREALAHKVFQKNVRVEWRQRDKYDRTLGHIFIDDRWVNKDMVKEGWAWHYRQYSKSDVLADAESEARTAKAGLWADSSPVAPWDFRHPGVSAPQAAAPAVAKPEVPESTSDKKEETVYVTKTGAKYHRAGCRHLQSSIPMSLSEAAKRYSPCSVCNPPSPKTHQASAPAPAVSQASAAAPSSSSIARPAQDNDKVPATVDRNPNGEQSTGQTATGIPTYTGSRGGQYHYSRSGKKVYERRKR
jgi:endonuclease YncB( thermonuclease family)